MTPDSTVPSDTDRLAEEVDAIRAVIAAEEKGQRAYWGTDDVQVLLAWADSLRGRLDTAEGRLATAEQECDDLAIQRNHLKNRLEDLGVIVDDED